MKKKLLGFVKRLLGLVLIISIYGFLRFKLGLSTEELMLGVILFTSGFVLDFLNRTFVETDKRRYSIEVIFTFLMIVLFTYNLDVSNSLRMFFYE